MHRRRERERAGIKVIPVEIGPDFIDALVAAKLLARWDEDNRAAIAKAVARFLLLARSA
jgi:hypothetical protein